MGCLFDAFAGSFLTPFFFFLARFFTVFFFESVLSPRFGLWGCLLAWIPLESQNQRIFWSRRIFRALLHSYYEGRAKKMTKKYDGNKKQKKYSPEMSSKKASREPPKRASKMGPEGDPKRMFSRACCGACLGRSGHLVAPSIMRSSTPGPGPTTMTTTVTQSLRPERIFGSPPPPQQGEHGGQVRPAPTQHLPSPS